VATDLDVQLPPTLHRAVHALFAQVSRLRRARSLHPKGAAFAGTLHVAGLREATGSPFLDHAAEYRALVRFSRGAGLPEPLPDVLGIAIRAQDADGPGRHRDLLFSSAAAPPILRRLLTPAVRFGRRTCTTILPYRTPQGLLLLAAAMEDGPALGGLRAAAGPPPAVHLLAAPPRGPWRQFGTFVSAHPLDDRDGAALAFDPWHAGPDLQPAGFLNALRRPAYAGSRDGRAGRGAEGAEGERR
jgi:hypothetical protein